MAPKLKVYPRRKASSWLELSRYVGVPRFDKISILKPMPFMVERCESDAFEIAPKETVLVATQQVLQSDAEMPLKLKLRANNHNMQHALYFKLKAGQFARPAFTLYNPNSYTVSLPFNEPMIEIDSDVDFESEDTTEDEDGLAKFTQEWDARDMLKRFEADTEPILVAESIEVQLLRATLFEHMQLNPYTAPDPADWKSLELPEPMRDEDGVPNFSVSIT